MGNISENLKTVRAWIDEAVSHCRRSPSDVRLLAVSKTKTPEMIREAYDAGQRLFGENYAQEYRDKANLLKGLDIEWHFIGHLQRNKVKYVVPTVSCIHSINSVRLAEEVNKRLDRKIDILIEINLAKEETKTGLAEEETISLVKSIRDMEKLNLKGLMTMPPFDIPTEETRNYFGRLRAIRDKINEMKVYPTELTELSMGMTTDLEIAIEEGSTIVRVGTAIFGEREYK